MAHLQSCDPDALLLTLADNDTFPLWYLQQVEGQRRDIKIMNLNLEGLIRCRKEVNKSLGQRPIYLTHYAYTYAGRLLGENYRCEGYCYRLLTEAEADEAGSTEALRRHVTDSIHWHITPTEYIDPTSRSFLALWQHLTAADTKDGSQ